MSPALCWTQNLIFNGSFEDITECPDDFGQIEKALGWNSAGGTVDLFDTCSVDIVPDPPQGALEYADFRFGSVYTRFGFSYPFRLRSDTIFREYMQGRLTQPLDDGLYYLSFYAYTTKENRTNRIGYYFAPDDVGFIGAYPKDITPQFELDEWLGGYNRWQRHGGCVEGIEGTEFFVVGNFNEPGQDRVEFPDIEFSNVIFFDEMSLIKIPFIQQDADTILFTGDCMFLDSVVNGIPVTNFINDTPLPNGLFCPDKHSQIEQRIPECGQTLKTINVQVFDCSCDVFVPNAVNTNSLNVANRTLTIGYDDLCTSLNDDLKIYDRWGGLVHHGSPDGFNPDNLNMGVYLYTLSYTCKGEDFAKYGDFTVIR